MSTYPVHYRVVGAPRFTRLQLLMRVLAFCALGIVGLSFGMAFTFAFIALPVVAASRLAVKDARAYLRDDAPWIAKALHWFAAVCAWAGLITDRLPARSPDETIQLSIEGRGEPTSPSAVWRVATGLPSAFVLALLCAIGVLVWLWAALSVLFTERVGPGAHQYLVGLQRWSVRLLAYQASLVDEYPPFSFSDPPPAALPMARGTP